MTRFEGFDQAGRSLDPLDHALRGTVISPARDLRTIPLEQLTGKHTDKSTAETPYCNARRSGPATRVGSIVSP